MKTLLMITAFLWALAMAAAQFTVPQRTGAPASAAPPTSGPAYYGPQIAMDGLNNQRVGCAGASYAASYRFRASESAANFAFTVRIYLIFNGVSDTCGVYSGYYAGGNGGTMLIQLQTDDGTASHLPSGTVLASVSDSDTLLCNNGTDHHPACTNSQRQFTLAPNVSLTAGNLYHIVFTNTDAQPSCNWFSVDELNHTVNTPNVQPTISDIDLRGLRQTNGTWADRYDYTPIFDFAYPNGDHQGQAYLYIANSYNIYGTQAVRETFTVSGGDVHFSKAFVRVNSTSGSPAAGTIAVLTSGGSTVASGTFAAASINAKGWAEVDDGSTHTLDNGSPYNFVFSSSGSNSSNYYVVRPMQAGTNYGFHRFFPDGHFQSTIDGSNWTNYPANRTDFDLSFYLEGTE